MDDNISVVLPAKFEWDDMSSSTGIVAQEVGSINLSGVTMSGFNGTSSTTVSVTGQSPMSGILGASIPSITITDPYEEMEKRLAKLEKIIAEEEEVRKRCEAVNNAYNEYRLLLVLAQKNKGDLLTED